MGSRVLGGSCVKEGEESLNFTDRDIDDRIINLRFIRGKSKRGFTIRSDYEPVFYNDGGTGSIGFKRCTEKPDIKVTYKQVAERTAIEVDIEVNNFSIGDAEKESNASMDSVEGDPVTLCLVQMGYRSQFPNWAAQEYSNKVERYYELNNNVLMPGLAGFKEPRKQEKAARSGGAKTQRAGRQVLVQILSCYPQSYPPERNTLFKGIIGTVESGLRWEHTSADLVEGYGAADFPVERGWIEKILFQFVTRRFLRPSAQHFAAALRGFTYEEALKAINGKDYKQEITVFDPDTGKWRELRLENGIMSVKDALDFGVTCAASKTLRGMGEKAVFGSRLSEWEAAVLQGALPSSFNDMQDELGGQLAVLQLHFPFLRWYMLEDGSLYFYHERDTDKDLWSDPFIKERRKKPVFLPAVYDMTPAGTRVIRCPFVSFIGPMTEVQFQSRFSIGTLTSFFYPVKTNAFLVIIASIEFATVQDVNVMELVCIDLPPQEAEAGEEEPEEPPDDEGPPEVAERQRRRDREWVEKELTVVLHRTGALDTDSRWANIVDIDMPVIHGRWPKGSKITRKDKLLALKEWNPKYFDADGEYMKRWDSELGDSIENHGEGIGAKTGVRVPWLYVGDKITVRQPFQPEYPPGDEVKWT